MKKQYDDWTSVKPADVSKVTQSVALGNWTVNADILLHKLVAEAQTVFRNTEAMIVQPLTPVGFQELVIYGAYDEQVEAIQKSLKEIRALEFLADPVADRYRGVMSWSERLTKSRLYYRRNDIAAHQPIAVIKSGFVKIDTVQGWVNVRVSDLSSYRLEDVISEHIFPDSIILNLGRSEVHLRYPDEEAARKMFFNLQLCEFL